MPLLIDGFLLDALSTDPATPTEGQVWYNTTDKQFKAYIDGSVEGFSTASELSDHINDTTNPHAVSATQVGNTTAQWNADRIQGVTVHTTVPTDGQVLVYSLANTRYEPSAVSIPGPAATAKSGEVLAASFAGNPKVATITFTTAYPNTNYSITLAAVTGGNTFSVIAQSQATTGFTINLGSNNVGDLVKVTWITMSHGEG